MRGEQQSCSTAGLVITLSSPSPARGRGDVLLNITGGFMFPFRLVSFDNLSSHACTG